MSACGPVRCQSNASGADTEFIMQKQTKRESSLPERLARCHGPRNNSVERKLFKLEFVQRRGQIARVEKDNEMRCVIGAVKK